MIPILLLFLLFYFKMLGAGDIKVFSVLGSFLGWGIVVRIGAISFVYGAIWSIVKLVYYRNAKQRLKYLMQYISTSLLLRKRTPYLIRGEQSKYYTVHFSVIILWAYLTYILLEGGVF